MILDFTPQTQRLIIDFTPPLPRCYLRGKTHTYIWLRDKAQVGIFLTMEAGIIEVVKVPLVDGKYHVMRFKDSLLEPIQYDLRKAVDVYAKSTLEKTPAARKEIARIMGQEVEEEPEKAPQEPRAARSGGAAVSLAELCAELGLEPTAARKKLRGKVEKPGSRWEWTDPEEIERVRGYLV